MKISRTVTMMIALAALTGCATSTPMPTATPTTTDTSTPTAAPTAPVTPTLAATTPVDYPMRLEQVGQFGGSADALALHGDRVYLKVGQRLVTVDVSDPTNPKVIGRSEYFPDGSFRSIAALGDYALVRDSEGILRVFTAPSEGDPQLVSSIDLGDTVYDMAVAEPYVYVAAGKDDLQIVDLSDPAMPQVVGILEVDGDAESLTISGNTLIIGSNISESDCEGCASAGVLNVADVSKPLDPVLVGKRVWKDLPVSNVQISGQVVYFTSPYSQHAVDISDPSAMKEFDIDVGDIDLVAGNTLFVKDWQWEQYTNSDTRLSIFQIDERKETARVEAAIANLPDDQIAANSSHVLRGNYLFIANGFGLEVYDVSLDPEPYPLFSLAEGYYLYEWRRVGWLETDIGTLYTGCCAGVWYGEMQMVDGFLYTFARRRFFVWNVENPEDPKLIKALDRPYARSYGIQVAGGIILDSFSYDGSVAIVDTRNPADPVVGQILLGQGTGEIQAVDNGRVFYFDTAGRTDDSHPFDLLIFDISDLTHPRLLTTYSPPDTFDFYDSKLKVLGNLAVLYPESFPAVALNVSEPSNPIEVDVPDDITFDNPVSRDGTAVFELGDEQLRVYAVDDRTEPAAVLDLPALAEVQDAYSPDVRMLLRGDWLFVQTYDNGDANTDIIDVENPIQPRLLAQYDQLVRDIAVFGDYLFFHLTWDGVGIFHLVPN